MTGADRACRSCGARLTRTFIDFGLMPSANAYLTSDQLRQPEPSWPLTVRVCDECLLVQADAVIAPAALFGNYAYLSSYSETWVEHARRFAEKARQRFALTPQSRVVEIASNDGYLLRHFRDAGICVLGVEPAANVADIARSAGIPTETAFFGKGLAEQLLARDGPADLVVANNVLAHVPDLRDFVSGLATLVDPAGVIVIEVPHLLHLMRETQFDTIYHEHFCYFSLHALERVFAASGLRVFDVESLATHGGSLRLYVGRARDGLAQSAAVEAVRLQEQAAGLLRIETYQGFEPRVGQIRQALREFLHRARAEGRKVAAYGAAAKGNTLLNACGITTAEIDYVVDRNPLKQNHFLPGSHIPVYPVEQVFATRPDYLLILPWNLRREILGQMAGIRDWGGRFVVAVPELEVIA
jgi:2-polyprenyl-3-methyl-5-hydroxy-6-metoxy-1,4-benzoquinol methylase